MDAFEALTDAIQDSQVEEGQRERDQAAERVSRAEEAVRHAEREGRDSAPARAELEDARRAQQRVIESQRPFAGPPSCVIC